MVQGMPPKLYVVRVSYRSKASVEEPLLKVHAFIECEFVARVDGLLAERVDELGVLTDLLTQRDGLLQELLDRVDLTDETCKIEMGKHNHR